jgi:hypothetical protein
MEQVHLECGHGAAKKMHAKMDELYANVTFQQIEAYVELCESCQLKKRHCRKSVVVKPIISNHMNSRANLKINEHNQYQLGTENGTLDTNFSRNQFTPCIEQFLAAENVPPKMISLREAARSGAMSHGKDFSNAIASKAIRMGVANASAIMFRAIQNATQVSQHATTKNANKFIEYAIFYLLFLF